MSGCAIVLVRECVLCVIRYGVCVSGEAHLLTAIFSCFSSSCACLFAFSSSETTRGVDNCRKLGALKCAWAVAARLSSATSASDGSKAEPQRALKSDGVCVAPAGAVKARRVDGAECVLRGVPKRWPQTCGIACRHRLRTVAHGVQLTFGGWARFMTVRFEIAEIDFHFHTMAPPSMVPFAPVLGRKHEVLRLLCPRGAARRCPAHA